VSYPARADHSVREGLSQRDDCVRRARSSVGPNCHLSTLVADDQARLTGGPAGRPAGGPPAAPSDSTGKVPSMRWTEPPDAQAPALRFPKSSPKQVVT